MRWPLVASLTVLLGLCSHGCQRGLTEIDRHIDRTLERSSRTLDGGATKPVVPAIDPASTQQADQASKNPPSTNPPADSLRYDPISDTRDVAAKLLSYSAQSLNGDGSTPVRRLTLADTFRTAQRTGREYLDAEEEYILAAIRLLIERHLWGPRFFNDTSLTATGRGDDGDFRSALQVVNSLRAAQKLPYGGSLEAALVWTATEQLRETAGGRYRQSSEIVLSGSVPLLRGAGLVAQESLIQAERTLVYQARNFETFRRQFMVAIARDYFLLLEAKARIANQEAVLANLKEILRGEEARFEAGRIAEFRKNIAANDVLRATADLAGIQESYILALDRFKIRLGLSTHEPLDLDPTVVDLREPSTSPDEAVGIAMAYRLELQNRRDQLDDARRAVANAKNATLADLNLSGSLGIPTDPDTREGGLLVQPDNLNYQAAATLGLPLDREIERLGVRQATLAFARTEREYARFRDDIAVTVRQSVRNIDVSRFQLTLAERQVQINQRRLEEVRLKADTVETQTKVDAANALQEAENARDRARTELRNAVLNFLLESGQLRVTDDGTIQPLPGMEVRQPAPGAPPPPPPAAPVGVPVPGGG